jgi:uncharacterized membrane protein (UPF0127 family)
MQNLKLKNLFRFIPTLLLSVFMVTSLNLHAQDVIDESLSTDKVNDSSLINASDDGKVTLTLGGKQYRIAYADTAMERQLGLMYRRKMCDDCGMLFKFDSVRVASIWMKNTYIPLDLAYITQQGEIVDIKQLTPHDLTSVSSSEPILYALEMNQGWFAKQDIRVGDKVELLP